MRKILALVLSFGLASGSGLNLAHAGNPMGKGSEVSGVKITGAFNTTPHFAAGGQTKPAVDAQALGRKDLALPASRVSSGFGSRIAAYLREARAAIGRSSPAHARILAKQGLSAGVARVEQAAGQVAEAQAEAGKAISARGSSAEEAHAASSKVFTRRELGKTLAVGALAGVMLCVGGCKGGSTNTLPSRRPSAAVLLDNQFQTTSGVTNYLNDQYDPARNPRGALYFDEAPAAHVMENDDLDPLHVGVPGLLDYTPATQIHFNYAYRSSFKSALSFINDTENIPSDLAALTKVFYNGYDWTVIYPTNVSSFSNPQITWDLTTKDVYEVQDYLNYGTTAEEAYEAKVTDDGVYFDAGSPIYPSRDLSASPIFYDVYSFPSFYAATSWLASNPDLDDFLLLGTKLVYNWADGTVTAFVPFDVDLLAAKLSIDPKSLAASVKAHTEQRPILRALGDRAQKAEGSDSERIASNAIASAARKGGVLERSVRAGKSPLSKATRAATRPVVRWDRVLGDHGISLSRERGVIAGLQRPSGNRLSSRPQRPQRERQKQ